MPDFPSSTSASGIWQMRQVKRAVQGGNWPPVTIPDPYFEYVSLLLPGNGTNGAQNNTFLDSSTNNFTITRNGNTTQGTFTPYGLNWSNYFNNSTGLGLAYGTATHTFWNNDFTLEFWVNGPVKTYSTVLSSWFNSNFDGSSWAVAISNGVPALSNRSSSGTNQAPFITAGSTRVDDGLWHQVVITQVTGANKTFRLFVDGVLRGYKVETNWTQGSANSTIYIGTQGPGTFDEAGRYLLGYLSNLRLTTSVVSAYSTSSTTLGTTIFTPPTAPLSVTAGTNILTCADNRFVDDSTNNFAITRLGDVSVQRFSPFNPTSAYSTATIGGSGYFDGSGDWVTTPNVSAFDLSNSSTNFTIEAWVYNTGAGTYRGIIGARQNAVGHGWCLYIHQNNTLWMGSTIVGNSYTDRQMNTTVIPANTWTHVALVKTASGYTGYVNGVAGSLLALTGGLDYQSAQPVVVGALGSQGEYPFLGQITDARIVKGTAVYTSNFTPNTSPLTAITNTSLLLNFTNAGIIDNAMMSDQETIGNVQISTAQSKFGGGSILFDGTLDFLLSNPSPVFALDSADFTIEGWFYFNDANANALRMMWVNYNTWTAQSIYFGKHNNASGRVQVWVNNFSPSGPLLTDPSFPPAATWVHYALVRNGSTWYLFRDGTSVATATYSGVATTNTVSQVGGNVEQSGTYCFNGYIDDFRITRGYARYTSNFSVPTAPFPTQ